jgi:hypothetical protein
MTKKDMFSVFLRVIGFWFLLQSITHLTFLYPFTTFKGQNEHYSTIAFILLLVGLIVIVGLVHFVLPLLLIFKADKIAGWLIKNKVKLEGSAKDLKPMLLEVALVTLGAYVLIGALVESVRVIGFLIKFRGEANYLPANFYLRDLPGAALRIGLGIYLLLGVKGFVQMLSNLRNKLAYPQEQLPDEKDSG